MEDAGRAILAPRPQDLLSRPQTRLVLAAALLVVTSLPLVAGLLRPLIEVAAPLSGLLVLASWVVALLSALWLVQCPPDSWQWLARPCWRIGSAGLAACCLLLLADRSAKFSTVTWPLWVVVGLLLHRGVASQPSRSALAVASIAAAAMALLWIGLLLGVQTVAAPLTGYHVYSGLPHSHYLDTVRNLERPADLGVSIGRFLNVGWSVLAAALWLWRAPEARLVVWLTRLVGVLALLHLIAAWRLAVALES